ncbi:MAG TPA: SDR family NAD(P)-dependent oxidoreductase [Polyangiaceae bacterium]
MSDEQRRIAVVTGAAGALGSAVAAELMTHGYSVAAVDLSPHLSKLQDQVQGQGATLAVALDPRGGGWAEAMARIQRELGTPSAAVLCAGGWGGAAFGGAEHQGVWERMLLVNLDSARRALEAIVPPMCDEGGGSVVVVGSRVVERPWEGAGAAAYVASKSAVVALCQVLAAEVRPRGVRVNTVLPSVIDTPQNRAGMPNADFSEWVAPRSLGGVIAFLLSDAARDVSGAALPVYGRV